MMRRRAKGEGGIYRRADGRWCAALDLGRATGKRRRRIVYGKSRREVSEKLFALRKDAERGGLAEPGRLTVEQYLTRWLEDGARPSVRPTTLANYRSIVRCHVLPRIGGERLARLSALRLQELYSDLERSGAKPRTRHGEMSILSAFDPVTMKASGLPRRFFLIITV